MKIGLALGGGGAKGLAHIPLLEVFDEFGIRPSIMAGTSIGAVIGALYASGRTGKEIREFVANKIPQEAHSPTEVIRKIFSRDLSDLVSFNFRRGAIFDHSGMPQFFEELVKDLSFETLVTPIKIVAADFWNREQIVFESGDLDKAVLASMAIPGIFQPVEWEGRILVDGGGVNPLPFDLLPDECDKVVAIDVSGILKPEGVQMPGAVEAMFGMTQVMSRTIVESRLKTSQPDLFLRPHVENVRVLEFWKAERIYAAAETEAERLRIWLRENL